MELVPLDASFVANDTEKELRALLKQVWGEHLQGDTMDANLLGAAQFASDVLTKKFVNHDGLVPMPIENVWYAMDYLYRAWKAQDRQGRGLAFLLTYMQLLMPNAFAVEQLYHSRASNRRYPENAFLASEPWFWRHMVGERDLKLDGTWLVGELLEGRNEYQNSEARRIGSQGLRLDGTWRVGETFLVTRSDLDEAAFLTSRLLFTFDRTDFPFENLQAIIRSVLPARLLPEIRDEATIEYSLVPTVTVTEEIYRYMTVLLLRFDDEVGTQTVTDATGLNEAFETSGGWAISSSNAEYGNSGQFTGMPKIRFPYLGTVLDLPFQYSDHLCFEAWVTIASHGGTSKVILTNRGGGKYPDYEFFVGSNGYVYMNIGQTGSHNSSPVQVPTGRRVHIAVACEFNPLPIPNWTMRFYIDKALAATHNTSGFYNKYQDSGWPLQIGHYPGTGTELASNVPIYAFVGFLDELRITKFDYIYSGNSINPTAPLEVLGTWQTL